MKEAFSKRFRTGEHSLVQWRASPQGWIRRRLRVGGRLAKQEEEEEEVQCDEVEWCFRIRMARPPSPFHFTAQIGFREVCEKWVLFPKGQTISSCGGSGAVGALLCPTHTHTHAML